MTWTPAPDTIKRIEAILHATPVQAVHERKPRHIRDAPLSSEELQSIKEALDNGTRGNVLAALYDVSDTTISNIKNGKR